MKRLIRCITSILGAMLILASTARAAIDTWEGAFPELPALSHHAYRAAAAQMDTEAILNLLWPGLPRTSAPFGEGTIYTLDAKNNPRGKFREQLEEDAGRLFYYWEYNENTPRQAEIGGYDAAFLNAEAFLRSWLPAEMLRNPLPHFGSFDEDGIPTDRYYELVWAQEIEPGVRAHGAGVRASYYSYGVSFAGINWLTYTPDDAGIDFPTYLTAEQALASLNYAAKNIDPEHACSNFLRQARIAAIDPVFSEVFHDDGLLTLCWAFTMQDIKKGIIYTVLVDAATGEVYDEHDGFLPGLPA